MGIIEVPYHIVRNIFLFVTSPIRMGYKMMRMFYHIFHRNKNSGVNSTKTRSVNESEVNMMDTLSGLGESAMQLMTNGSSQAMMDMGLQVWTMVTTNVLPMVDNLLIQSQDSDALSDATKMWLKQMHNGYKMLHLFKIA